MTSPPFAALVGINKPAGLTSHDVVARLRRALGCKRIGHAGTLDPKATGVLIMGVGEATRLLGFITLAKKSYIARFALGSETTTDDAEGEVVARHEVDAHLSDPKRAAYEVQRLVGPQSQVPPQLSAISQNGQRAWKAFRGGKPLDLAPREITVFDALLLGVETSKTHVSWTVALTVSKGCYVRALARDMGRALGCFAHVDYLARTKSGPVTLDDCAELVTLEQKGWEGLGEWVLDPLWVAGLHRRALSERELQSALAGRALGALKSDKGLVGLVANQRLWGVWERRAQQLCCKANFPSGVILGSRSHG